ncbi:MAG: UDP-3-O-(3-hydroxymyristoyl)glucosamine N-acyltransferase [bacterium]
MEIREGSLAVAKVASSSDREVFVHPTAVLEDGVRLGNGVCIHAHAVIASGVCIHDNVRVLSGCYIGEDCVIGEDTVLQQNVVVREKTQLGKRVVLESGVVVGSDGFGYAKDSNGDRCKIPQIGFVIIEDDVRVGANTTIDRATLGKTVIHSGCTIGSLVQVAHNVTIGERSVVKSHVGICGSNRIGPDVFIGHAVGMVGHISVGPGAQLAPCTGVTKDIPQGSSVYGYPGCGFDEFQERRESFQSLPGLWQRLRQLERDLHCTPDGSE